MFTNPNPNGHKNHARCSIWYLTLDYVQAFCPNAWHHFFPL